MKQTNNIRLESGAVLVFVCLLLFSLVVLLGLAIDTSRWFIESSEQKSTADAAALGALDAYWSTVGNHSVKFASAVTRAAAIGGKNFSTVRNSKKFIQDARSLQSGIDGEIKSGKWWLEKPPVCSLNTCPCGSAGQDLVPCFQECDDASGCTLAYAGDSTFATAIRIGIKTETGNGIVNFFGGLLGSATQEVTTGSGSTGDYAIASLAPRYGMLLVDLSRRTQFESDLPFERGWSANTLPHSTPNYSPSIVTPDPSTYNGFPASEFSFLVIPNASDSFCPNAPGGRCVGLDQSGIMYSSSLGYGGRSGEVLTHLATTNVAKYANYQERVLDWGTVFIDTSRDPEPLATILEAAHGALETFKTDANHLDRIGLVGYDQGSAAFNAPRYFGPINSAEANLDSMLKVTQTTDEPGFTAQQARLFRIDKQFFPGATKFPDPSLAHHPGNAIVRTVAEVMAKLPRYDVADNYIGLFTQGVTDCTSGSNVVDGPYANVTVWGVSNSTGAGACARIPEFTDSGTLNNDIYGVHQRGFSELVFNIGNYLKDDAHVKIHVALAGKNVGPHTLLMKSLTNPNQCMDDDEMRRHNYINVLNGVSSDNLANFLSIGTSLPAVSDYTALTPYFQPNYYLYALSRLTQGSWMPIRPPCVAVNKAAIDNICAGGVAPDAWNSNPDVNGFMVQSPALQLSGAQDAAGRLLCDPEQRPVREQGKEMFRTAFSKRTLMLVE